MRGCPVCTAFHVVTVRGLDRPITANLMRFPTQYDCHRYLNRLAQLHAQASDSDRMALVALASRLQKELAQCVERERVELDMVKRLTTNPLETE